MTDQQLQDEDQAAYQADMDRFEQEARRVIEKAKREPITEDEAALLRWSRLIH